MFGKLFGKKPASTAAKPSDPTRQPQHQSPAHPPSPTLPAGRVFWEITRIPGNDIKFGHGIGHYLVLGRSWDELGNQRRAAATAASPKTAPYWGSSGFPAYEYRYKPEHFPKHMTLNNKAPKKKKLPEYSAISSAEAAWVVSARVAHIIERFEPERFNFIPFTVAPEAGTPVHNFCFWQPLEQVDAVVFDRSGFEKAQGDHGFYWRHAKGVWPNPPPLILHASKLEGRHFVTTNNMNAPSFRLISDELKQALGDFLPDGFTLREARAIQA